MADLTDRKQTPKEEIANALTHGLGVLFCLIGVPVLIYYAMQTGSTASVWAVSVFGFGMFMVYLSSTLFHAVSSVHAKKVLQVWDHISIYLLIAGSYTPLVIKFIEPGMAKVFLSAMWLIVAVGVVLKVFYTGRFQKASLVLYLALGWMALLIIKPLIQNTPLSVLEWLVAGGLIYTGGVLFYVLERKPYYHAIWHCFVLSGTVAHYVAVYKSTVMR